MKTITTILICIFSMSAFAQSDSTNLPGISANVVFIQQPGNVNLPDTLVVDKATQYTETEVLACPTTGGNGYGYYPNGTVPTDGSSTVADVSGGVIEERTVITDRFGTTVYGNWTQVNFLCTAIPAPPSCPTGQTQTSAPYWDSSTNQWLGLQCQAPTRVCQYNINYPNQSYVAYNVPDAGVPAVTVMWNGVQVPPLPISPVPTSSIAASQNIIKAYGYDYGSSTPTLTYRPRGTNETTYFYQVCKIN
jgi:hypothetical protein